MATAALPSEITSAESSAIDSVQFDHLVGDGNDEFHNEAEPAGKPKKKVSRRKAAVSPADQQVDGEVTDKRPLMTSPEWHDFCIRQLAEDESDANGNPYVHGLRRIVEELIGPILSSKANVIQSPAFVPGMGQALQPAVVEYTLRALVANPDNEALEPYEVEYTDVADVYAGNTDPEFARFATSMAATRAEGRCYRKLLRLKRVAASEELTLVPISDAGLNGFITNNQINFIDNYCRILKISVMSYINMGESKYESIDDVKYETAAKMSEHLALWVNNKEKVPEHIKGYDHNWRNS